MKPEDIRGNSIEELAVLEGDLRRQLWKARFDNHTNQLDDTSSIQKIRRDLARVKTVLTERRVEAANKE
ncbi:MAG: 50S ribosomal protein L29 [Polyangiales bacterium]